MERSKIIEMIESGKIPEGSDFKEIQRLALKYPYCSTFKILSAMGAKEQDELELKEFINMASIYVQDRSKLYDHVIRDGLLRKIEEGERSEEIDKSITTDPNTASRVEPKGESDEKIKGPIKDTSDKSIISKDPLEEQIMAAAVVQLGEIEMESEFEKTQKTGVDESAQSDENQNPLEEEISEGSAFIRYLQNIDRGSETPWQERAIIEKFISEDRKITPAKKAFFSPTQMGKMSLMEDESFVTETLAKIYERQGDYKKAARAYKNLRLKYPEKRRYFAALQKQAEEKS